MNERTMGQGVLFADEAMARATDPETSHEAAASAKRDIRFSQSLVLAALGRLGMACDEEIRGAVGKMSPSGARTRRSELVAMGLVEDSGERVLLPSGRRSVAWRLTSYGKEYMGRLEP